MPRSGTGRKKLKLSKIPNGRNRLVSFSKRKKGIFNKANELSTLCGAEVGVLVFSATNKLYSFGSPWVEKVVDRYLSENSPEYLAANHPLEFHHNKIPELNTHLNQVKDQLEVANKRGLELDQIKNFMQSQPLSKSSIEELDFSELEQLKTILEMLQKNFKNTDDKLQIEASDFLYFVEKMEKY